MKEVVFKNLIDNYNKFSYTHHYMFGFIDRGVVYCAIAESDIIPFICTLDSASRDCGFSLRFKPTKAQKELLKTKQIFVVCSEKFFDKEYTESKYNRGEIFEKMVTEHFGQQWEKDNVQFTDAGDIVVDNIHYQIKFEKATFINEKGLQNLLKNS